MAFIFILITKLKLLASLTIVSDLLLIFGNFVIVFVLLAYLFHSMRADAMIGFIFKKFNVNASHIFGLHLRIEDDALGFWHGVHPGYPMN